MTDMQLMGTENLVPITADNMAVFPEGMAEAVAETTEEGVVDGDATGDGGSAEDQRVIYRVEMKSKMTRAEMGNAMREWVEDTRWWLDNLVADGVPASVLASDMPEAVYANIRVALSSGLEDYQSVVELAPVREKAIDAGEGMSMPLIRGARTGSQPYERGLFENLVSIAALILTLDALSNNTVVAAGDSETLWPFAGAIG